MTPGPGGTFTPPGFFIMSYSIYCTTTETTFILSSAGQTAFLDDNEDGSAEQEVLSAIEIAAADMNAVLLASYVQADLPIATPASLPVLASTNAWLKWANARLAVAVICQRRLLDLPASLSREIERIWDLLNRIANGDPGAIVPGAIRSLESIPTVSNLDVQRRYNQPVRVSVLDSTGAKPVDGRKRNLANDPYYP